VNVIGVDPGPVPGFVSLSLATVGGGPIIAAHDVVQCSRGVAGEVLRMLLVPGAVVATEQFVTGARAARSSTPRAGTQTRQMIGELEVIAGQNQARAFITYPAAAVMPWATDDRLDATGLLAATKGMQHARAAARHALYAAVKHCRLPDPLSRAAA
jgi:hypothetical protein